MRVKFKPWAKEYIEKNPNIFIQNQEELLTLITKYPKVYLEIGCGKGKFSYEMAKKNPDVLYIGIEKFDSVIVCAGEKNKHNKLDNLYFYAIDIEKIFELNIIEKVDKIFLNFSDPWPKKRHAKRRLTNKKYLNEYKKILKENGIIEFKTDNQQLFEYSLVEFNNNGWYFEEINLDLHNSLKENVLTEYEEKFSKKGFKINYGKFKKEN